MEDIRIVEEAPQYSKNMRTGAILNTNKSQYNARLARISNGKKQAIKVKTLEEQVAALTLVVEQLVGINNGD